MKTSCVALLLTGLSLGLNAQEQRPSLLFQAAHCLAAEQFLPPSKATVLSFGYLLDSNSYPGEKVLFVVTYTGRRDRFKGMVFAIFLTEKEGEMIFNIQNNGSFVRSKDKQEYIDFVDPPLGGTWTQEHLISAIEQIESQPRFAIPVKDLIVASAATQCESYADRK